MTAGPALRVEHLGFRVGGAVIVDDVSLAVSEGEFVSIIGPNGAGKTSLFNLLSGLNVASSGSIELLGRDITREPPHRRALLGLGRTFQTSNVFNELTALENVRLGVRAREGGSLNPWRAADRDAGTLAAASRSLAAVGLSETAPLAARQLPHGAKRRLELAILLGGGFQVLLLDEPTSGLSVEHVPEMVDVIRRLHREEGRTILMVEHRMDLVIGLSDRIAVMHQGKLLTIDTPAGVMADARVQQAYLGPDSL